MKFAVGEIVVNKELLVLTGPENGTSYSTTYPAFGLRGVVHETFNKRVIIKTPLGNITVKKEYWKCLESQRREPMVSDWIRDIEKPEKIGRVEKITQFFIEIARYDLEKEKILENTGDFIDKKNAQVLSIGETLGWIFTVSSIFPSPPTKESFFPAHDKELMYNCALALISHGPKFFIEKIILGVSGPTRAGAGRLLVSLSLEKSTKEKIVQAPIKRFISFNGKEEEIV